MRYILAMSLVALSGYGLSKVPSVIAPSGTVPQNVRALAGDSQITISWTAVSGANAYNIYWNTREADQKTYNVIRQVTSPYVHQGLANGMPYHYMVAAVGSDGEGGVSREVAVTPGREPVDLMAMPAPQSWHRW